MNNKEKNSNKYTTNKNVFPLIPLRNLVPFPSVEINLTFGRPKTSMAINVAYQNSKKVVLVAQKDPRTEDPKWNDYYHTGVLCEIEQVFQTEGGLHAVVKGIKRVGLVEQVKEKPFQTVKVVEIPDVADEDQETRLSSSHLVKELRRSFGLGKSVDPFFMIRLSAGVPLSELLDQVGYILEIPLAEKQEILETASIKKRLNLVINGLSSEIKVLELEKKIDKKTQTKFEKSMKKAVLEEKKRTIERELKTLGGAGQEMPDELVELRKKIKKSGMPKEVMKKAEYELNRLEGMPSIAPEASYIRTYLEVLADVPWKSKGQKSISIKQASKVLNDDHYGLKKVKERILEYLAVMKLKKESKINSKSSGTPNILCFVGPPGVGKTSLGKSIAKSLGREFIRISLGGVRDEAEIRGHRRTYVGAMPGRIIQAMRTAGTKNPVFMLDEVDKIGADYRGDPSAALLEALDPEQNTNFSDHYLEVPYDLSEVFFILTGNVLDTIPPALRDRLEIIRFSGYTEEEKLHIAKKYLVPKQIENNGLAGKKVTIEDSAIKEMIRSYTREAGVRNLERVIANVARKVARKIAEGKKVDKAITKKKLDKLLGPREYAHTTKERKNEVGIATGLAWTQVGGEILFIEVALMPGNGKIYLTGKLGDVMKESCQAAVSFLRSHWNEFGISKDFGKKTDIHIHVPEGAVPKDGPSAGVAIATALYSALTKKKVHADIGMTGEITLRGKVLPIGGVKEKVLAAHRADLKTIMLPKENKKDMNEVPSNIKKDLKFVFVDSLDKVFQTAIS